LRLHARTASRFPLAANNRVGTTGNPHNGDRDGTVVLVIYPEQGQVATLHYILPTSGNVSILVFDLAGNVVRLLTRASEASGDYAAVGDGKNQGGRAAARGIYFIRIVAPGIDETRKVLVAR
jgi:flagellar hook assembly protein FlgD